MAFKEGFDRSDRIRYPGEGFARCICRTLNLLGSLHDALRDTNFEVIYGAEARSIVDTADDRKLVRYNKGSSEYELTGDPIVVADGGSSSLRSQSGIAVDMVDYNVGYQMVILDKSSGFKGGQHCLSP